MPFRSPGRRRNYTGQPAVDSQLTVVLAVVFNECEHLLGAFLIQFVLVFRQDIEDFPGRQFQGLNDSGPGPIVRVGQFVRVAVGFLATQSLREIVVPESDMAECFAECAYRTDRMILEFVVRKLAGETG